MLNIIPDKIQEADATQNYSKLELLDLTKMWGEIFMKWKIWKLRKGQKLWSHRKNPLHCRNQCDEEFRLESKLDSLYLFLDKTDLLEARQRETYPTTILGVLL